MLEAETHFSLISGHTVTAAVMLSSNNMDERQPLLYCSEDQDAVGRAVNIWRSIWRIFPTEYKCYSSYLPLNKTKKQAAAPGQPFVMQE